MKVGDMELRDDIFNIDVKKHILWEVVRWQLAARRQGTHSTKTRGEVNYSGRKLLPQKGTGSARHGDRGANIFVGGGVAHGPRPKDYYYNLPKKVRRLGLKMALSSKAREGNIVLFDDPSFGDTPKTKKALDFLRGLGIDKYKVAIVMPNKDEVVMKSFRNLQNVRVLPVEGLNVYDILWGDKVLIHKEAIKKIYERLSV
ncbi:MAG: 50S ribosomal protein L4 [Aquificaceae bacterium]